MTHKQWLFRNMHVHYKKMDRLTETQHEEISKEIKELIMVDPGSLLDKHRYLLEWDFGALGEGFGGGSTVLDCINGNGGACCGSREGRAEGPR